MNMDDKRTRQLLADLDEARDIERRTKHAYRYVNTWAPLLFSLGLAVWVVGANLYDGPPQGFSVLAAWLIWLLAAWCIAWGLISVPRDDEHPHSYRSIQGTKRDVRDAERAFNDHVTEHS